MPGLAIYAPFIMVLLKEFLARFICQELNLYTLSLHRYIQRIIVPTLV